MLKYRYPGAHPFSAEERNIFYGREQDAEKLLRRIYLAKVVVLHSKSGLGKSSLINAGIIPQLDEAGTLQSIRIRFGAHSPENPESPVIKANQFLDPDEQAGTFLDELLPEDTSLWRFLKKNQIMAGHQRGYLLVIDQFEELFTYPTEQIQAFARRLTELQSATVPQRFLEKAMLKKDLGESELKQLHQKLEVRVLLAIRSDRLHLLGELSTVMPSILSNLYELKPLSRAQAEDAILKPAYDQNEAFLAAPFDIEDEAIEQILDYLTPDKNNFVEPFQLQIICRHLEQEVIRKKLSLVTSGDLGDLNELFENYYQNQITALGTAAEQKRAQLLIEDGLVFEEEERRLTLYEGQIEKTYGVDKTLLSKLIDSRLLRAEPSPKGGYTYELSHDTLVRPVLKSRARRKAEEARLQAEQDRREREAELAEERKKRRQATRLAIIGGILSVLAIGGMIIALVFYNRSEAALAKIEAINNTLENTRDSIALANADLLRKDSINLALQNEMERWGKFAIILSRDGKRGEAGADYELQLRKRTLKTDDISLIKYTTEGGTTWWYTAIVCNNPKEAFERLPEISEQFKNTSRGFGTPWIKWFYGLQSEADTYQGADNQNDSGLIYQSKEPIPGQ